MKAKMYNFNGWCTECDPVLLQQHFYDVLKKCGFNICGTQHKYFEPYGYTGLYLLSESHFAIHTFPEEGKTYIELSSCVEQQYIKFIDLQNGETENYKIKQEMKNSSV